VSSERNKNFAVAVLVKNKYFERVPVVFLRSSGVVDVEVFEVMERDGNTGIPVEIPELS